MTTRKRPTNEADRLHCIRSFLERPHGGPPSSTIRGQGFYLEGYRLYTKDPDDAKVPEKAIIGEWKKDGLHLYNRSSSLGRDTVEMAHRLGIEVANGD